MKKSKTEVKLIISLFLKSLEESSADELGLYEISWPTGKSPELRLKMSSVLVLVVF